MPCEQRCFSHRRPSSIGRREFLVGAGALGAFATSSFGFASSVLAQAKPRRIDVHHHVSPPTWLEAVKKAKLDLPPIVSWSPQKSLEDMDKAGVGTSVVSPTIPQVTFLGREDATRIARESNEYVKKLIGDHPGRFGMFAMLPLPYVDESLKEIEYAFDVLKADGIGTMTSYGDKWLGHPDFAPVFEALNRRRATVFTHPPRPSCCTNLVKGIPESIVEFAADTGRTIASLVFSGTSQRFKDVNLIFSHGGGVLTSVVERFDIMVRQNKDKFTKEAVDAELRRFHYDTAQVSNPVTMAGLTKLVPISQIVFGTDYPFRTAAEHVKGLEGIFGADGLEAIGRRNAERILPRLRAA